MAILLYKLRPDLRSIIAVACTIPANQLEPSSVLRLGNVFYCLWQYVDAYRAADTAAPLDAQLQLATLSEWLRDRSTSMRRFYQNYPGKVRLSLTEDAQTQMNRILSRDPTVGYDFDLPNACARMVAGISIS